MNLENNLQNKLEFSTRRKGGLVQTRYMCIGHGLFGDDDEIPRFIGNAPKFSYKEDTLSNSPWKLPDPWKIIESVPAPVLKPINLKKYTDYFPLLNDESQTIGITHHSTGLGKIKIFNKEEKKEYGIPIIDILSKSLKDWNIDKK